MTGALTRLCPDCRAQLDGGSAHDCPLAARPTGTVIGSVIDGRYEIIAVLGEGGMGVVYKGRHVVLNKPLALKVLRQAHSEPARHRFVREAQAAAAIKHSSIVDITDFGVMPDGRTYLVMEYLEGQTLSSAISEGLLDPQRSCRIAVQIARGLAAVHDCGIVHRDLKPDNVFLVHREGERDLVKIVDFGIAKLREGHRLTDEGMVVGTAEYMSPEQATGQDVDPSSDQYSLGCILYEMLTGELPFSGKNIAAVMHKHVYEPLVPPRKRAPRRWISPSLEAVILRAMDKDPERRFPSMLAMMLALQHELDQLSYGDRPTSDLLAATRPPPPPWRRTAVLATAVALAAALGLLVLPSRARRPATPAPLRAAVTGTGPLDKAGPPRELPPPVLPAPGPLATPPAAAPGPAEAPLRLSLFISRPTDVPVSVSCAGRSRSCQGGCVVTLDPGTGCQVRAAGFIPRLLRHGDLARQARDGHVTQRVALSPVKL